MDNASIHKDVRIKTTCQEAGVSLQFLPPYSPDYNPIESTFKDLKAWVKKNCLLVAEFCGFAAFLEFAVQQQARKEVRGHFWRCGYTVNSI
jgi:transposase